MSFFFLFTGTGQVFESLTQVTCGATGKIIPEVIYHRRCDTQAMKEVGDILMLQISITDLENSQL